MKPEFVHRISCRAARVVLVETPFHLLACGLFFAICCCGLLVGCQEDRGEPHPSDKPVAVETQSEATTSTKRAVSRQAPGRDDIPARDSRGPVKGDSQQSNGRAAGEPAITSPDRPLEIPEKVESRPTDNSQQARREQADRRSGLLTAGLLDDLADWSAYEQFLNRQTADVVDASLLRLRLEDSLGNPVSGARVDWLPHDQNQTTPYDRTFSRADGRAILAVSPETRSHQLRFKKDKVRVRVRHPQLQQPVVKEVPREGWQTVVLPIAEQRQIASLDLCLVLDTTSSMGDELGYLQQDFRSAVERLTSSNPDLSLRLALVCYRDVDDVYVTRNFDFVESRTKFFATLQQQSADGGGDYPEAVHVALQNAAQLNWRSGNSARVVLLVTDAPAHRRHDSRVRAATDALRNQGVAVFPLAGSGAQPRCEVFLRQQATRTGGRYLFLTDHSERGHAHARPQAMRYDVESLNQLLFRLLVGEVTGRMAVPDEVIATEETDGRGSRVPVEVQSGSPTPVPQRPPAPPSQHHVVVDWHDAGQGHWNWVGLAVKIGLAAAAIAGIFWWDHCLKSRR